MAMISQEYCKICNGTGVVTEHNRGLAIGPEGRGRKIVEGSYKRPCSYCRKTEPAV